MKILTVIQARRGSSRLPDKVMLPLAGKPLLARMAERVGAAETSGEIVVATTTDVADDVIVEICEQEKLNCFRGHPADLLDRHYKAALAQKNRPHAIVKIPSDCPLIDPSVIDKVIRFFIENESRYDYVSNLHPPTYPDGNDVEIMHFSVLEKAWENAKRPLEREHTTPFMWENPEQFRIGNVEWENGKNLSMTHRFTIDYKEDYDFIKAVYDELFQKDPLFSLEKILKLLEEKPHIFQKNLRYAGVNWYRHHLDELKTVSAKDTRRDVT